jgi:dTDP-4-amino-4,6-dideoxygalactose transaminase
MIPKQPIYVTQPFLPPLEEFQTYLQKIWDNKWLTNNGPFHQQLEKELCEYLGVKYISLFTNGTLALVTALQALDIKGEVITTPYSFVATSHALVWNNLNPVFVDVDSVYGNLDPDKIEAAITPKTTAILAVHVYGNPCETEKIQNIARKHKLKVIYDAAHAFGVTKTGEGILNKGDMSVLSFHATKVFHTFEGGAIVCHDAKTKQKIDDLKNFGFRDEVTVVAPGINAKMNEIQAAMGLLQLKSVNELIEKRKALIGGYRKLLESIKGIRFFEDLPDVRHNYSYFPVFVGEDYPLSRDALYENLKKHSIYGRRYFYPLISNFPTYRELASSNRSKLIVANLLSEQVICLPIYPELEMKTILSICDILKKFAR